MRLVRLATAAIIVAAASGLALVSGSAAHADVAPGPTPGVSSSCSTLTVKPTGFVDKGEVRVVVDGEVQTDGSSQRDSTGDDWHVFTGSFPGVYDFDPRVAHHYSVEINSWSDDSDGRSFSPGHGADGAFTASTTPCSPVSLQTAPTNCTSSDRVTKQGLDLTIGDLRRSTTYLVEVLSGGTVVTHFQFRTQPEITKHFSGLTAGTDYVVRVTDQSDDSLSTRQDDLIPGCAAPVELGTTVSTCTAAGGTRTITADVGSLVVGRGYDVALTSTSAGSGLPVVSIVGDGLEHRVAFSGLSAGTYRVGVSDDAAPRVTRSGSLNVASCAPAATPPAAGPRPTSTPGGAATAAPQPVDTSASAAARGESGEASSPSIAGSTVGWARGSASPVRPHLSVSVDGAAVALAKPGQETAPRPGAPTAAIATNGSGGLSPVTRTLLWVGGGTAAAGAGVSGFWLLRRRFVA